VLLGQEPVRRREVDEVALVEQRLGRRIAQTSSTIAPPAAGSQPSVSRPARGWVG
jgi:hypothetical protein